MLAAFVALKRRFGSPTHRPPLIPSATSAPFEYNPSGCKFLGRLSALLAKVETALGIALCSRLEIRPKNLQQRPPPFNQWFLDSAGCSR